jgi:predicted ABC-class ATPase
VPSAEELRRILRRIDGRGYRVYKEIRGHYDLGDLSLHIDHVQGDPFAAPSKLRVRAPMAVAKLPADLFEARVRRLGLADFLAREVHGAIHKRRPAGGGGRGEHRDREQRGSGKRGLISIDAGGQEVLERSAVVISSEWVEARLEVGLPAAGRRVLGRQAEELLLHELPAVARKGLLWEPIPGRRAREFALCVENQEAIREQLDPLGLIAFVGNGAILPRESGASDRPLRRDEAVPFQSPPSFEVAIELPNPLDGPEGETCTIQGMGIGKGVTLIVGGGYHGKSTLLRALERCVYPHVPGDGREYVVTSAAAVKIRAEDGRRVEQVDIHPFIDRLPRPRGEAERSTRAFCSDDASGSTSQAANIVEAVEVGVDALLLDEDTCATNFMVRDARMQALVHKDFEPITPFLDRVRELHDTHGVSTALVMGGCGDYFDVADRVIMLRDYRALDVTAEARDVARANVSDRRAEALTPMEPPIPRLPRPESFDASRGRRDVKIDAKGLDQLLYGSDPIDLRAVEQLVDRSQTRAVGLAIHLAVQRFMRDGTTLAQVLDQLDAFFDTDGLDALDPFHRPGEHPGNLARPRRFEIAAAINRLRTLRIDQS